MYAWWQSSGLDRKHIFLVGLSLLDVAGLTPLYTHLLVSPGNLLHVRIIFSFVCFSLLLSFFLLFPPYYYGHFLSLLGFVR